MHSADDFDKLAPRYPPVKPPSHRSPFEFFDGDTERLDVDLLRDDEEVPDPEFGYGDNEGGKGIGLVHRHEDEDQEEVDDDPTSSFWFQFKSVGPKLVPFFKTLGMYFVIFIPSDRPSWFATLIKCLPVASLALFVLLHGISMGKQHSFARKILMGLLFSCLGDALLIWPDYFLHGMIAFGLAQICYILAFGFEPENYTVGVVIYGMTSVGLGLIMPGLMLSDGGLVVGVPVYIILLTTMAWRAMARVQFFEDLWTWTKVCSSLGGILFVASDTVLGLNKFFVEIPHSQAAIMITYYLAQLGIALSVVNSHKGAARPSPDGYEMMNDMDGDYGPFGRQGGKNRGRNVTWQKSLPTSVPAFDSEDEEDTIPFSSTH